MQYFSIDKELNRIYSISKITEIDLADIHLSGYNSFFPLLSVTYLNDKGETEYISYTPKDKYFDIFVKKIVEVYNKEKNENVLPQLSSFTKTELKIDDRTKLILENGTLEHFNDIFKFYKNKKSYDSQLLLDNVDLEFMLPIALYNLNKFLERTDCNLEFSKEISGYKYNYVLHGSKDERKTYFPFTYTKKSDNEVAFEFGNLFPKTSSTFIDIKFKDDKIIVIIRNDEYKILNYSTYEFEDNKLHERHDTEIDKKLSHFENIDYTQSMILEDGKTYYKLPWGAFYGITKEETPLDETGKIVQKECKYIHSLNNRILVKETFAKEYKNVNYLSGYNLSEYIRTTISHPLSLLENIHLIQTYFHDTLHTNEYYDDKLNSKYFYHVSLGKEAKDITEEDLYSLYSEGIKANADLYDLDRVLKLIGGKNNAKL